MIWLLQNVNRRGLRRRSRQQSVEPLERRMLLAAAIPAISVDGKAPAVIGDVNGLQLLGLADADSTRLFTTNGTQVGTFQFSDIPAVISFPLTDFAVLGTELFFAADGAEGVELWKTNGTAAGTALVKDINLGVSDSSPGNFAAIGDTLFFAATTISHGRELWKSDGTAAGTILVIDLAAGSNSSRPGRFVAFDNQVFFAAFELDDIYRTDGTASGTILVLDKDTAQASGRYDDGTYPIGVLNGRLMIKVDHSVGLSSHSGNVVSINSDLMSMDSASAAPQVVHDAGLYHEQAFDAFEFVNGRMVYRFRDVYDTNDSMEARYQRGSLWSTDGTVAGTQVVALDIYGVAAGSKGPTDFAAPPPSAVFTGAFGEAAIYSVRPPSGTVGGMYYSDGTPGGTVLLVDVRSESDFYQAGSELFFIRSNTVDRTELWKVNSAGNEAMQAALIDPFDQVLPQLAVLGEHLCYPAPLNGGAALWKYDPAATPDTGPEVTFPRGELHITEAPIVFAWEPVPSAQEYEVRVSGHEYNAAATNLTATEFLLPDPPTINTLLFGVRAIRSDGSATEWNLQERIVALVPDNLALGTLMPFGDQFELTTTDPDFDRGWVQTLLPGTNQQLWHTSIQFGPPDGNGVRRGVTTLVQARRPADGIVTVRVRASTDLTLAYREITVNLKGGPSGLGVNFGSGDEVTLNWNVLQTVNRYDLWVDDMTHGIAQYFRSPNHIGTNFTEHFPDGTWRFWVRGRQSQDGPTTAWSEPFVFTPGVAPRVGSPFGTFRDGTAPETFEWSDTKDAVAYELWVNDLNAGTRIIHETELDGGTIAYDAPFDLKPSRYAAWVRAEFADGSFTAWSDVRAFTIQPNKVEFTSGVGINIDRSPELSWQSPAWATTCELWISEQGKTAPLYRRTSLTSPDHELETELPLGNYDLWVRAYGPNGLVSPWGDSTLLQVGGRPQLTIFSGSAYPVLETRRLTWTLLDGSTHYDLWVDRVENGAVLQSQIVRKQDVAGDFFSLPESLPAGQYRAWVRAIRTENGGTTTYISDWSNAALFSLA